MSNKVELNFSSLENPTLRSFFFYDEQRGRWFRSFHSGHALAKRSGTNTFRWTRGVRALCYILAEFRLRESEHVEPIEAHGRLREVTTSYQQALAHALERDPKWLRGLFGRSSLTWGTSETEAHIINVSDNGIFSIVRNRAEDGIFEIEIIPEAVSPDAIFISADNKMLTRSEEVLQILRALVASDEDSDSFDDGSSSAVMNMGNR